MIALEVAGCMVCAALCFAFGVWAWRSIGNRARTHEDADMVQTVARHDELMKTIQRKIDAVYATMALTKKRNNE